MPELPEVEVTARALDRRFGGRRVQAVQVHDARLRWGVPKGLARELTGQPIVRVDRRGKYLLWHLPTGVLISHLGMSGSWRVHEAGEVPPRERHDHVEIRCDGAVARLNDPRRFGALLWHARGRGDVATHARLAGLGMEPFDPGFGAEVLYRATRGRRVAVKQLLLAGRAVVGVGNIYASESLFAAGIDPRTPAGRVGRRRYERLAQAIRAVLSRAIEVGGSTLRDFSSIEGASGRYTEFAQVYDRAGLPCRRCAGRIRRIEQSGRATYFCPRCQRP